MVVVGAGSCPETFGLFWKLISSFRLARTRTSFPSQLVGRGTPGFTCLVGKERSST